MIFRFQEKKCQKDILQIFFKKLSTFMCNLHTCNRTRILNADPDPAIKIMRIRIRNSAVSSLLLKSGMPGCLAVTPVAE